MPRPPPDEPPPPVVSFRVSNRQYDLLQAATERMDFPSVNALAKWRATAPDEEPEPEET